MAQKNKQVKQKKSWKNPTEQVWAKILIVFLAIFMGFGSLVSLVWLIIEYASKV